MVFPPLLQHYLKKRNIFNNEKEKKNKSLTMKKGMNVRSTVALNIINVLFVGLCSAVATPMCIALFDQQSSIPLQYLERDELLKIEPTAAGCQNTVPVGQN